MPSDPRNDQQSDRQHSGGEFSDYFRPGLSMDMLPGYEIWKAAHEELPGDLSYRIGRYTGAVAVDLVKIGIYVGGFTLAKPLFSL